MYILVFEFSGHFLGGDQESTPFLSAISSSSPRVSQAVLVDETSTYVCTKLGFVFRSVASAELSSDSLIAPRLILQQYEILELELEIRGLKVKGCFLKIEMTKDR